MKRTHWNGVENVGIMHACGHDAHTAILMGVAEMLAGMRKQIPGTVKFIFQPAEETPPIGEDGGAKMMVEQGCLKNPDVTRSSGCTWSPTTPPARSVIARVPSWPRRTISASS
jgi:amidohydrolase